jgi:hypothetical protein
MLRRQFIQGVLATAALSAGEAADTPWGNPVLDIHLHPRRDNPVEIDHLEGAGVRKAVLLPGVGSIQRATSVMAQYTDRFPVLIHFEEGGFNLGFKRLPSILKSHPKTIFIGHAQTWWANISADAANEAGYPTGPVKSGGLTDKLLSDYPNIYGDLSATSSRNALARDPEFSAAFSRASSQQADVR